MWTAQHQICGVPRKSIFIKCEVMTINQDTMHICMTEGTTITRWGWRKGKEEGGGGWPPPHLLQKKKEIGLVNWSKKQIGYIIMTRNLNKTHTHTNFGRTGEYKTLKHRVLPHACGKYRVLSCTCPYLLTLWMQELHEATKPQNSCRACQSRTAVGACSCGCYASMVQGRKFFVCLVWFAHFRLQQGFWTYNLTLSGPAIGLIRQRPKLQNPISKGVFGLFEL